MDELQEVIVQLGTNIGDRKHHLEKAIIGIQNFAGNVILGSIYVTKAWGLEDQEDFYNQIVKFSTEYNVFETFRRLNDLEDELGRTRKERWGPRVIDIDILFFGNKVIKTKDLQIPHPRMCQRRFVLEPLQEYWADYRHPIFHTTLSTLLEKCNDSLAVNKLN